MSNETKHTPGPWFQNGSGDGNGNIAVTKITENDQFLIAGVFKPIHGTRNLSREQAHCNAQLIAAAPEMLNVLADVQRLKDLILPPLSACKPEHEGELQAIASVMGAVDRIIAKAKGDQ